MKNYLYLILVFSILILTACNQLLPPFATFNIMGSQSFMVKTDDPYLPEEMNPFGVENRYELVWPQKDMLTEEAERELIEQVFGDSTTSSVNEAAERWLNNLWLYEDTKALETQSVDSVTGRDTYTYSHLKNSIQSDKELVTFINTQEIYIAGAAHGGYYVHYLTYDRKEKRVVHLSDLVDTSQLGEVILRAVEDLTVNKEVLDCLFDEFKTADRLPVTDNFLIDTNRSTITLVYQQYDITPYACGLPSVVMPIFWLSKHLPLTPYAQKLFGEGSYLKEDAKKN